MPLASEVLTEVIVIDCKVAAVTLIAIAFDVIPFWVAVMLLEPIATPVASPLVLILAVEVLDEFQVTELVRSCAVPSLKVPVAVN